MGDKIGDNPSIKEIEEATECLESMYNNLDIDSKGFIEVLREGIADFKYIDEFNKIFSKRCWVAHEGMDRNITKEAINTCKYKGIKEAEEILIQYYEEKIPSLINRYQFQPIYKKRARLLKLAIEDYKAERYYAFVPVFLAQLDGIMFDFGVSTGLYSSADKALNIWDSIIGHVTGLDAIISIYNKARKITRDEINIVPYRNGIMHGRDLNYDNKLVATKVLAMFSYVNDWIKEKKRETTEKEEYIKNTNKISINEITKICIERKKISEEIERFGELWKARDSINLDDLEKDTPEYIAREFIKALKNKNFKIPTDFYPFELFGNININEKIKKFSKEYKGISIISYKLASVKEYVPEYSTVYVLVNYEKDNKKFSREIRFKMVYEVNGESMNRLVEGGKWKIGNIEGIIFDFK